MQDADNLDQTRPSRSEVDDMNRPCHPRFGIVDSNVPKMKAAEVPRKKAAVLGHRTFWSVR
jgi:hypothetical protein